MIHRKVATSVLQWGPAVCATRPAERAQNGGVQRGLPRPQGEPHRGGLLSPQCREGFSGDVEAGKSDPRRGVEIEHLKARHMARDQARGKNGRTIMAENSVAGVVDFPVDGSANHFTVRYIA